MKTILKNQEMLQDTRNHHPRLFLLLAIIGMLYVGNTSAQHRGMVQSVPKGGKEITIDGNTYYEVDRIQYQPIISHFFI